MAYEKPELVVRERVPLSEILEEYDRPGRPDRWICGDLVLGRAARGVRDKDGRSSVGHPDDPPVLPPTEG